MRTCSYDSVLLHHGDDRWTWWLDLHHTVTDAWASSLVFDAVSAVYGRLGDPGSGDVSSELGRLVPFYDFADRARRDDLADGSTIVPAASPAVPPAVTVETDRGPLTPYGPRGGPTTRTTRRPVDARPLGDVDARYRTLSPELTRLCLIATATAVTLHRLDGRSSIELGIPLHHRSGREAPHVIGPLMELSPLRVEIDGAATFAGVFDDVHRSTLELMRHARAGDGPSGAFDAIVNVLTARYGDFAGHPASVDWVRSEHAEAAHPIRVHAYDFGDGIRLDVDVNEALSTDGAHTALPAHLSRTLEVAAADPGRGVGGFDLVTDAEIATLDGLNPPSTSTAGRAVHLVVAERLRAEPGRVVADHDGVELTASELDDRADAVAGWLADQGVGRGARVGVRMRRSLDVLVAVHAVMRAGAAFVMLDPDDPPARHEVIARDAELVVVLDELPHDRSVGRFDAPTVGLDDIAYVLYTSGSTGPPKGVPIPHRGLADYLDGACEAYATRAPLVMPLHSSLVFDLTITSLFLPQLLGGRTVVISGDPVAALSRVAADPRLNALKATPSQLELLRRMAERPLHLDVVIVGGEAFRTPQAEAFRLACHPGVRIYNEYGPTEAVVGCMLHRWDPERDRGTDVPIGRASPGAEVFVLDRYGRRSPVGAWGELYVRRPGMAEGYLHLPEQSAARFAEIEAIGGGPVYRTGDRVRVEHGELVFGGRIDEQLNVGGVRVEPGEIEAALVSHPMVSNAVVRVWTPKRLPAQVERCARCGLGTDVPDVTIDGAGTCSVCREFERIEPRTREWFRSPSDLDVVRDRARTRTRGAYDGLHLLSGGKDSTYALYQLIGRGWRVHALTLDNGFISEGAKANIRRTISDLGVSHEFVTTDAMSEIFRDSLDRFANVCNGCYKTIYTIATARAHELGIPVIVTGLSRGQFFETRLIPHQFDDGRFDPDAIDRTVLHARRAYHQTRDAVTELLPEQAVFERDDVDVLSEIEYVDFYRYVDVALADMYEFLEDRAPWVRPEDTGRSTNCLVNVVGIHVHRTERGFHNYAQPYSWDVRLGHKTRDEALDELDDEVDVAEIDRILAEIGYEPKRTEVLTAWYQTTDGSGVDGADLASHLRGLLPARSLPAAFVHMDDLPLAGSAKLDVGSLPAPVPVHRGSAASSPPITPTEAMCADVWSRVLGVDRIGLDDDFFALGGASLAALETVAAVERRLSVELPDALVFDHRRLGAFAAAVDAARHGPAGRAGIAAIDDDRPTPLSAGQESMLFEYRSDPTDTRYNVTRLYTVAADIDVDRLRRAFATVVERHQPLHTAFDATRTRLTPDRALSFRSFPTATAPDDVADVERRIPFDLDAGPLVRVHVGETAPGCWSILVGAHHITIDAGTFDLLWDEVDAHYHGRELRQPATTYAAHAEWQRGRVAASAEFWQHRLDHAEPGDRTVLPGPVSAEPDGYIEVTGPMSTRELVAAATTTPFATALAAAATVLGSHARGDRVEMTLTASTKDHVDVEPLVGYYLNTVPVTLDVPDAATLADLDATAGRVVTEVLPHRAFPYAEIVRTARERGRPVPDGSFMLAYERLAPARFGDVEVEHRIVASGTAVSDVTFFVQERGDDLRLGIEYRGSTVGASTAQRLLDAFGRVLLARCRRPELPVGDVRSWWAADDLVGPPLPDVPPTVLHGLLAVAEAAPDRPAVVDGAGRSTTFAELVERASSLAVRIRAHHGEVPRVGVAVGRSRSLIEAIVGVQLSGAAYVPIDPEAPRSRRDAIVAAAGLDVIVVDATTAGGFPGITELDMAAPDDDIAAAPPPLPGPDDAAYVMFTSGSTGTPAGVEVTHANLATSTAARTVFYGEEPPARFLLTPSIGFDSSMVGIFWPLASGGTIVVPDADDVHDVDRLAAVVSNRSVTHLLMVPSLYRAVLIRRSERLTSLRTVIVAGEACPADLISQHHHRLPGVELVNEYGPTEATVWATAHRCRPGDDPVPIGTPIAGATIRIANARQRALPPRTPGELLIAGPGVVGGYVSGRADDVFVDDGDRRWYRTGDLVRTDADGRLVFLGRVDDQLNVGGVRLEPGDIESLLVRVPGIDEAAVVSAVIDGRESLVAHVVGDPALMSLRDIRGLLARDLPAAAVPHHVTFHDDLPRNVHGKLDRRRAAALPLAQGSVDEDAHGASALVEIWRSALRRPDVGPDDDFFESGGDSLAAVEIVSAVGDLIGREVAVAALLTAPTPVAMAAQLGLDGLGGTTSDQRAERGDPDGLRLLTLRAGTPDGPVVVMTAAWDDVQAYRALADAFPSEVTVRALVVLDDPTGEYGLHRVTPVVDAALTSIEAWLRDRPASPLAVLGWSVGGIVAYDLAQRLAEDGVPVTTAALVDTFFPGEDRHRWSNRWWKYKSMLRPGGFGVAIREFTDLLTRRLQRYAVEVGRWLLAWGGQPVERPAVQKTKAGVPLVALDHTPGTSGVPVVLYAARTTNPRRTIRPWRTVAPDLRVVELDGRHRGFRSIMGTDRVHHIADDLMATALGPPVRPGR